MNPITETNKLAFLNKAEQKKVNSETDYKIGNPKLSEKAASYYETLKTKYKDADFILVDDAELESAKQKATQLDTKKDMYILISASEVERMVTDDVARKNNEAFIENSIKNMPGYRKELEATGAEIQNFGIEIDNDGNHSFYVVIDKSLDAQKERIEEAREEKKAEQKKEKKELETLSATTFEELIQKLKDYLYAAKSDQVLTEQEKLVGSHIDFSL